MNAAFSRNENYLHEIEATRVGREEGRGEKKEFSREEQAGVNSRRIFMGRLVEQGLRKLVNRLIALNDERRDFSGQQDRGEEGLLERSSSFHRVYARGCLPRSSG